ncbi:1,4-alpha-glucan branching enzyme [Arcanobacterium wilhelmae]|uniref:1,4-alpha-glucan branching enzyme n=1 Tax=Arcanobacterium wilhelmae TaxID=1803177 RepID=A0ABT9N9W5_9ACTO|nr:phosphotransferase [Arcanobacterium wilhelmae]MDP9800485.1 1,4-alpha-glucan branching enzyme [Arcanobacterium wilhelmae]WFN89904.1 phosphotransferase [Arcanobacterium wilhelmae]
MEFNAGSQPWQDATALEEMMRTARWYRGHEPKIEFGPWARTGNSSSAMVLQLIRSEGRIYQVPIYLGPAMPSDHELPGYIGPTGNLSAFDATEHPAGTAAIYEALLDGLEWEGPLTVSATALRGSANELPRVVSSHKLSSEQSNTSVIYNFGAGGAEGAGIIIKIFRVVSAGRNPDVELMEGLEKCGTTAIPRQYGSLSSDADGHIDLAVAVEFLAGSVDAWQVLTAQAAASPTLADPQQIVELGAMTREIHRDLAGAFPTITPTEELKRRMRTIWQERAQQAILDAPELAEKLPAISTVFDAAVDSPWPELTRIHGDLHLGQVLRSPERGWVALDFEGEPLRPLELRQQPDVPLRDVAGMLRSFDYAAGATGVGRKWATQARAAFLEGYGPIENQALLDALELDKALYEVSYEAASRPDWIHIPLAGVDALLTKP